MHRESIRIEVCSSGGLYYQLSTKHEVGTLPSLHIFRGRLRKRRDQNGQGDRYIARDICCVSSSCEFSVNSTLVEGDAI